MDTRTRRQRSDRMSRIRNRDTKPEMVVRRMVHSMGYRYRLHQSDLPSRPDLVFSGRRRIILVHDCFWHRHIRRRLARLPKSRIEFWETQLSKNVERDQRNLGELQRLGWEVLTI
ncbi:very short patch repair endonuclease [Skermanella stibiiresistens]|uniref:very short patch repair endonuclease n=1 Tax=Skermanella stibiiresistens TaxID=913326 RepID=UPI000A041480|nr:DNA mismatch endonuclease Vsr [Skermanella stibiiresistens]